MTCFGENAIFPIILIRGAAGVEVPGFQVVGVIPACRSFPLRFASPSFTRR